MVDGVFTPAIVESYRKATLTRWATQLVERIIPENVRIIRSFARLEGENPLDRQRWQKIDELARRLIRDDVDSRSLCTRIREAVARSDLATASALQLEMKRAMGELSRLYRLYRSNLA
jgi:glutamine synthetase